MKNIVKWILVFVVLISLIGGGWWTVSSTGKTETRASVAQLLSDTNTSGFARAFEPRTFNFPQDHGAHPEFQTEWWYYTGNLVSASGGKERRFGYQFTIFRRALAPQTQGATRQTQEGTTFATQQLYFAHFAITDADLNQHASFERFSRAAAGLADAQAIPFKVFIEDWTIADLNNDGNAEQVTIKANARRNNDLFAIDLTLRNLKPMVLHGDRGLSAKSSVPGNASYYYSFTRMETSGKITTPSGTFDVQGNSWMDREWSTSALSADTEGWDWFALQLDDNREVMVYLLRHKDGSFDAASKGTLVEPDGTSRMIKLDQFKIDVLERWRSPHNGADYPIRWRVTIPSADISLEITPMIKDQEMKDVSTVYWEGAVTMSGKSNGKAVTGKGYIEMTGYQEGLNRRL
jgi:predicted secreted hydrolase